MRIDQDVHLVRLETPITRAVSYQAFVALVDGLMIDSGFSQARGRLLGALKGHAVEQLVNTHAHEDHCGNNLEIAQRFKAEVFAPAEALGALAHPGQQNLMLYQRVVWGRPRPSMAKPLGTEVRTQRFRFEVIRTPGHSHDHVCYFERERGWLFGGDLFLSPKVHAARPLENGSDLIDSLERVIALEPRFFLCYHRGPLDKPLELLRLKRDHLLELREKVRRLHASGMEPAEIARQVLGGEPLSCRITTGGDFSREHLIRSLLKAPGAGYDTVSRVDSKRVLSSSQLTTLVRAMATHETDAHVRGPDHLAQDFLDQQLAWIPRLPPLRRLILWRFARKLPGGYLFAIARTRHIDSLLVQELEGGTTQVVLLGAGYDSRAYRFRHHLEGVRLFEVDHLALLERKKARVARRFGALPSHVTYVPTDFTRERLADVLPRAGYDPQRKTFFIWEGVMMYLPGEAVDATLEFVRRHSPPGSSIVFDYLYREALAPDTQLYGAREALALLKSKGEPFLFGIPRGQAAPFLEERGLVCVSDMPPEEQQRHYLTRSNGEPLGRIACCAGFAHARVPEDQPPRQSTIDARCLKNA